MSDPPENQPQNTPEPPPVQGLTPIDLLELPPMLARVIRGLIRRRKMSLNEVAAVMGQSPEQARRVLRSLVEKGYVRQTETNEGLWYEANFKPAPPRKPTSDVLSALDSLFKPQEDE